MHLPKTREEALHLGVRHFFTGKPCKRGHTDKRFASTNNCLTCNRGRQTKFYSTPSGRAYHNAKSAGNSSRHTRMCRENISDVQLFYMDCPPGYEVDHIIPRHGTNVCGFNTLSNLQYLPKEENRRKRNKVDPLTLEAVICVLPQYRSYIKF